MNQLGLFDEPPQAMPKSAGLPAVSISKSGGRPEVCFRNPEQPAQAWTGRGKPPRWIAEWVQGGKSLEALRVLGTRP